MFNMRKRRKSKHEFNATKVRKAEGVNSKINSKIENEIFG